jgi:hypothetical protein
MKKQEEEEEEEEEEAAAEGVMWFWSGWGRNLSCPSTRRETHRHRHTQAHTLLERLLYKLLTATSSHWKETWTLTNTHTHKKTQTSSHPRGMGGIWGRTAVGAGMECEGMGGRERWEEGSVGVGGVPHSIQ